MPASRFGLGRRAALAQDHTAIAPNVHTPAVAGSFYPSDPAHLRGMIEVMLAEVDSHRHEGDVLALVAPHAGYLYSGSVAASAYAAVQGCNVSRVVILAPSHFEAFPFTSVYDGDAYETPLGSIAVDKEFALHLTESDAISRFSHRGHDPSEQGSEHAIEVQLPWLQHVLGAFRLVPVVMGNQSYEASRSIGSALATLVAAEHESASQRGGTLIVASSDLSHYFTAESAEAMDRRTLHALESWDYFTMAQNFASQRWEACGGGPILAAMIASEHLGANIAQVLKYAHSGHVTGDQSRVVGYSAVALVRSEDAAPTHQAFQLSREEKDELLSIARRSVEGAARGERSFKPDKPASDALRQERGAFVTLRSNGHLRGCIGYSSAVTPLYLSVWETAALAATHDPRFHPIAEEELPDLQFEISVLSPLRRIRNVREIHIGQDGLVIRNGNREGLLLPQVATEHRWDCFHFLEQTCIKAGLPKDCWTSEETDIFAFTAAVFGTDESAPQAAEEVHDLSR